VNVVVRGRESIYQTIRRNGVPVKKGVVKYVLDYGSRECLQKEEGKAK
jgi:hypothetical protein